MSAVSGDERTLAALARGAMDSDVGAFTADERARDSKMLEPLSRVAPPTGTLVDDDDETAVETDAPPSRAPPKRPAHPPPTAAAERPRERRASPRDRDRSESGRRSESASERRRPSRRSEIVPRLSNAGGTNPPPQNDSETEPETRGNSRAPPYAPQHHMYPQHPSSSTSQPQPQPRTQERDVKHQFSLPDTPGVAVRRFDTSMDYIISIFRALSNDNPHAVDVANYLLIFREQIRLWCQNDQSQSWEDAAKFMTVYAHTMECVIHTTAQSVMQRKKVESMLIPPMTPPTKLESPRGSKTHASSNSGVRTHHEPRVPPPDATRLGESTESEAPVHYNRPHVPAGLHLNHPVSEQGIPTPAVSAHTAYAHTPPAYAAELGEKNDGKCALM